VGIQIVILAAGMGSRLGRSLPKALTELGDGRTIMQQQFDNIRYAFGDTAEVTTVVGYKREAIMKAFPEAAYVHNDDFATTNTSKSLMMALARSDPGGVLWMNGDIVYDPAALERAIPLMTREQSFVTVNTARVADEEVKYTTDAEGYIHEISKTVRNGLGEAIGINYISAGEKDVLVRRLEQVDDQDYFERGIELGIERDKLRFEPLDISDLYAVEVDFAEDLARANLHV